MKLTFFEFLCLYADEFNREISDPQYQMANWLDATDADPFRIVQAYRESGKSDTLRLWVVWKLFCDPAFTVLIISATAKIAGRNSREIRSIIEKFSLTKHLKPANPDQWQTETFTVNRPHGKSGDASVNCTSVTASNTGMHAHILLGDDVEVAENIYTDENREYLWERIGAFQSLCTRQLFVGTPHHEDTIYKKLGNLANDYKEIKIPVMDENGIPANPDVEINGYKHDETWIEWKRSSMSPAKFSSQYLLEAVNSNETLFDFDLLNHYDEEMEVMEHWSDDPRQKWIHRIHGKTIKDIAAYWDPAYGTANRDSSVLAVCFRTTDGDSYVHRTVELPPATDRDFDQQYKKIMDTLFQCGLDKVYVEENFAPTLANSLREYCRRAGQKIRVIPERRIRNKTEFIGDTIGPEINTGKLYIHKSVWRTAFKAQLKEFPRAKHDDFLDAACGALDQLKLVREKPGNNRPATAFTSGQRYIEANTPPPI